VKQTRSVRGAATEAQPAEGVETLGAGPGGTWQPRPEGPPRPQALKSPATFKRAVTDLTSPCWREPEGGLERRSGEPGGESPEECGEVCERKQRPINRTAARREDGAPGSRRTAGRRRLSQNGASLSPDTLGDSRTS
jgi:hypothetical protein